MSWKWGSLIVVVGGFAMLYQYCRERHKKPKPQKSAELSFVPQLIHARFWYHHQEYTCHLTTMGISWMSSRCAQQMGIWEKGKQIYSITIFFDTKPSVSQTVSFHLMDSFVPHADVCLGKEVIDTLMYAQEKYITVTDAPSQHIPIFQHKTRGHPIPFATLSVRPSRIAHHG